VSEKEIIEPTCHTAWAPWQPTTIHTAIDKGKKTEAAKRHLLQVASQRNDPNLLIFYSDGSKLDDRLGAGVHFYRHRPPDYTKSYSLGKEMEVFDAELYGVKAALLAAKRMLPTLPSARPPHAAVFVYLDNQAAIKRIKNPRPGPGQSLCLDIHALSQDLAEEGLATFIEWVPGHTGIEGNNLSDEAARLATSLPPLNTKFTTSQAYLKRIGEETKMTEWATLWRSIHHGTSYDGGPRRYMHPSLHQQRRSLVSTAIQLMTGHGYFGSYFTRFAPDTDGDLTLPCFCGARSQTPEHLLLHCPLRREFEGKIAHINPDGPPTKAYLLHSELGLALTMSMIQKTQIATRR
jgi:ribonuclease HI